MRAGVVAAFAVVSAWTPAVADAPTPSTPPPGAAVASAEASPSPAAACCRIPAGTAVALVLVDPLSSKTQKAGATFHIRLDQPITVDGQVAVAAGAEGVGEVIDAAPGGMGGRGGKLVLAARYLESGGVRLPLQSFKIGVGGGADRSNASLIVSEVVGPFGLAVHGGNVDWPAGTAATAKLSAAVTVAPAAGPAPAMTSTDNKGQTP